MEESRYLIFPIYSPWIKTILPQIKIQNIVVEWPGVTSPSGSHSEFGHKK